MAKVADPSKTTICDPPMHDWQLRANAGSTSKDDRNQLRQIVDGNAARLGTGKIDNTDLIIATGHQAWLWHPGILAKDIAMKAAASTLNAGSLHVVVDQDTPAGDRIELPMQQGDELLVGELKILSELPIADIPTGLHRPTLVEDIGEPTVRSGGERARLASDLQPLREAMRDLPECSSLAEQIAVVLHRLWQPSAGDVPVVFVSQLAKLDAMKRLVRMMCDNAEKCVAAYNEAVKQRPTAGIAPLAKSIGGGLRMVELPLWVVIQSDAEGAANVRERAYFDIDADQLMTADGRAVEADRDLVLPRALTLTALMRSAFCDLFIHGTGGGVYDRITEAWWQNWQGETLAPMAVVTANLYRDFDAPVASRSDLLRAIWFEHHLPHNVDRYLKSDARTTEDDKLIAEKRELLKSLGSPGKTRDYSSEARAKRAKWFAQLHEINAKLAANHSKLIDESTQQKKQAQQGVRNAAIAKKRDWCFALYERGRIKQLQDEFAQQATLVQS